ncbi:MAG: hypothetical protein PHS07_01980 [Patescibacteria group bacterium]|jgi:cell division protein FtsL|nr:hypothetical protein [Patescibacteria group bacterium]
MYQTYASKFNQFQTNLECQSFSKKLIQAIKSWSIFKINLHKFKIIIGMASLILFVVYLMQVNFLATAGFKIQELKQDIQKLETNNQQLELQAMNLQSISRVKTISQELKMVSLENVDYLTPISGSMMAAK